MYKRIRFYAFITISFLCLLSMNPKRAFALDTGGDSYSDGSSNIAETDASCVLPLFGSTRHFSNGSTTVFVAIADFNNDGFLDIAANAHDASYVGIFLGDGTGNFTRLTVLNAGNFNVPVVAGDFNSDGNQDLAVGSRDGTVWVYLGHGNGGFGPPTQFADGAGEAYEIAVGDFNHDGKLDMAIAHQFAGLAVLLGDGTGGFSAPSVYINGLGPVLVRSADFNNDGNLDLITWNAQGNDASLLLGNGSGGFSASILPFSSPGFGIGDFDHDGNVDVVTAGSDNHSILFYRGTGDGSFGSPTRYESINAGNPKAADFNGDGNLDIAVTNGFNTGVSIIFGDGLGGFLPPSVFPTGNHPTQIGVSDFNNDGKPDFVTPNYFGADITVSINNGIDSQDVEPPVILSAPDVLADVNAPGGANVSFQIVAADNSGQDPTFDCNPSANNVFPVGSTNVTCTAVDACGNRSASFHFHVNVECGPIDLSPLGDIQVDADGPAGTAVNFNSLNDGSAVSFSIPSGSRFPIGTTHVTYTVTQLCGATLNGSFDVTVIDGPPVLSIPSSFSAFATTSSGKVVSYSATASDKVSGPIPVSCLPASGAQFPIGDTMVNCQAIDGAGNSATGSFTVSILDCIGCKAPTFEPLRLYDSGGAFRSAAGDFNADGKLDLAVTREGAVGIFYGDGAGNFAAPVFLPAAGFDVPPASGDFNNDGKTDLVVGGNDGNTWVYLNRGSAGLSDPVLWPDNGGEAYEIQVADFNSDGKLDLAIGHQFSGLAILMGDGNGGFASPVEYIDGQGPVQVSKGDFNNDGKVDLITANGGGGGSGDVSLLINNGNGTFNVSTLPIPVTDFAVGDFNLDNKTDIVAADSDTSVKLFLGNGNGTFSDAGSFATGGNGPNGIKCGDFNLDGKLDVVVSNGWTDTLSVLLGDGTGHFAPPLPFAVGSGPVGITVADFNADGKPDLAAAAYFAGGLSVLINNTFQTAVGQNETVDTGTATMTFDNVTSGGTTTVTPIADPATAGDVPGGFALASTAYEVSTTATFTGSVTTCFTVSTTNDSTEFAALRVLHNENGTLVDRTSSHDFPNRKVCATTSSFSPFYLATVSKQIQSLFDRTKAFKSGSTVPIKIKILNGSGQNLSAATLPVAVRGLRRIGNATAVVVNDAGNSNPDYTFRYDSASQSYIYNLKTTGLAAGKYVLSVYAGSDHSFFYTLTFDIR